MTMETILLTGITGFLGRNIVDYITNNNLKYNIVGIGNSEKKIKFFKKKHHNITVYKLNIADDSFHMNVNNIIKKHNVVYIIHSAAMKYVDICEENPIETIKTNVFSTNALILSCQENNVKNLICLSTDKANTPFNVYGMSKNIMERMVLKAGYSIYQGANFFGSDGSVLDIWFEQYCRKKPLTVTNLNHIRYFNTVEYISEIILNNLDKRGKIIVPDNVYKIKIDTLLNVFKEKFNYDNYVIVGEEYYEKEIEELDENVKNIKELTTDEIMKLLDNHFY